MQENKSGFSEHSVHTHIHLLCAARREGAISVAFVRPSVRPYVAYIANNSGLAYPNLEGRFPTFDATRILVSM